ncbi:hypothetical protein DSUL_20570 [Desulfovibrionales bacterium]
MAVVPCKFKFRWYLRNSHCLHTGPETVTIHKTSHPPMTSLTETSASRRDKQKLGYRHITGRPIAYVTTGPLKLKTINADASTTNLKLHTGPCTPSLCKLPGQELSRWTTQNYPQKFSVSSSSAHSTHKK